MRECKRIVSLVLSLVIFTSLIVSMEVVAVTGSSETSFTCMLERAEALINYEWVPSERIYTWNGNEYNGKNYFEAGETVKGVPYTLFSWELGFDGLLSLEQYKARSSVNYSTERYCNSVSAIRVGPAYGNCCATLVSEVFGGSFMNGSNPRYDGVGTVQNSTYSTTYKKVKASAIQPGDALSCTSGAHIVWVGGVTDDSIIIYESTPPVCQKVILSKASNTDSNGYLVYNGNTYNIVTKSNELIRDDLSSVAFLSTSIPMPIHAYTKANEKTLVYDAINGNAKINKIYGTDLCFIDAIFDNGWCHVNFPLDAGGLEQGYVKTSVFFDIGDISIDTAKSSIPAYNRSDLSTSIGRVTSGSNMYFMGETAEAFQVAYPITSGGYKLGWISKEDLENASEDAFLNQFCPIKGYPCVTENFEVKKNDYSTRGGEIYTTDYCTINEIYNDGWCQVTFPMDSGGDRTAYTPISNFVFDVDYPVYSYVTQEQIDVYTKKDLVTHNSWWTGIGDTIYILGEYGDALQICYPIDTAYGGGYKLGWIPRSSISVEQEKVLESISIDSLPAKTIYYIGEEIDVTGLELLLTYNDGSTEIVSDDFEVSGFDSMTEGTKMITISYSGKTTTFSVYVESNIIENTPKITIEQKTAKVGQTIQIAVVLENNPGIWGMDLIVDYSKTQLTLTNVTNGNVFASTEWILGNLSGDKYILSYEASGFDNITVNGSLATLEFTVNENATVDSLAPISVSYDAGDVINASFEDIDLTIVSGGVNIVDFIYGDLNDDGFVNKKDSLLMKMYLADKSTTINMHAADVYADGNVNKKDSLYLKQYLAGWINKLGH